MSFLRCQKIFSLYWTLLLPKFHSLSLEKLAQKYRNVFWMFCRWRMVRRKRASRRQRTRGTPSPSSSCLISWTETRKNQNQKVPENQRESSPSSSYLIAWTASPYPSPSPSERGVQLLRVSYRELQQLKVPKKHRSQNKAESKLIVSFIMNSNGVNSSNNKRRNQVQVELLFYVILRASIAKSL